MKKKTIVAMAVAIPAMMVMVSCSNESSAPGESGSSTIDGTSESGAQSPPPSTEPRRVQQGQAFELSGPTYGQGPSSGMTLVITAVDTAPVCETYDSAISDYSMQEQPFIAVEFDIELDPTGAPMSFGSPDWFRAKDSDGYIVDDLSVSVGGCDDDYPEFTNSDLRAGDKHRGWVFFREEALSSGDTLLIGWPYSSSPPAELTVPE